MEMVLGLEPPDEGVFERRELKDSRKMQFIFADDLMESEIMDLYRDATDLYGLIHARFIVSPKGLQQMVRWGSMMKDPNNV